MGYGNLAYKYDYTEEERQQQRKKAIKKPNNDKAKSKRRVAQLSYAGKIVAVLVVAIITHGAVTTMIYSISVVYAILFAVLLARSLTLKPAKNN